MRLASLSAKEGSLYEAHTFGSFTSDKSGRRVLIMPLTREQVYKLQRWLNSRGVNLNCSMCSSAQWETGEIISGTSVDDPGNAVPMVQVFCGNCGYVMLFASMPIGLV